MSVRNALLGLMAQQPRHAYELYAAFGALVGGEEVWEVKPAQIYTTLARLEEGGLVTSSTTSGDPGPERRIYALTPSGQSELTRWLTEPVIPLHERDEVFLKLMVCLAVRDVNPRRVLYAQRSALYQELHDLTGRRAEADPHTELARILLLDQAIMHTEADLRWLDMVEARLDDIARQPVPQPVTRSRGRPRKPEINR